MSAFGNIQVVTAGDTKFTNATDGDMCIYTDTNNQKICIGTAINATAALTLSNQTVNITNLYSPGSLIQTQFARSNTWFSTTSTAYVNTNFTVTITPKFANSLLYVIAYIESNVNGNPCGILYQIRRDNVEDTTIVGANAQRNSHGFHYLHINANMDFYTKVPVCSMFTAGNTTSTTFSLWVAAWNGNTIGVLSPNLLGRSEFIVYEIAQ